jgi:hypothetical protein
MRRRDFITLVGGAAAAWPLAARAQQPATGPRLGVLLYSTPEADPQMKLVRNSLGELGYVEGRNLAVSYYFAEGKPERLADLAAVLVSEKPDLILAIGGDGAPDHLNSRALHHLSRPVPCPHPAPSAICDERQTTQSYMLTDQGRALLEALMMRAATRG